jgi:hypothetical protein
VECFFNLCNNYLITKYAKWCPLCMFFHLTQVEHVDNTSCFCHGLYGACNIGHSGVQEQPFIHMKSRTTISSLSLHSHSNAFVLVLFGTQQRFCLQVAQYLGLNVFTVTQPLCSIFLGSFWRHVFLHSRPFCNWMKKLMWYSSQHY